MSRVYTSSAETDSERASREATSGTSERVNRPIGELFSKLASDVSLLIRQEIALAKKELGQSLTQALGATVSLVIGGVIAIVGLIALLAAAILALALIMPDWAAALIFGLVFIVVGLMFIMGAVNRLKTISIVPERTTQTLKDDAEMLREKAQ